MRSGRGLINPFDPSHVTIKLTSNRRRWTHIFPKGGNVKIFYDISKYITVSHQIQSLKILLGPTGVLIQQHHYQAVPAQVNSDTSSCNLSSSPDLPRTSSSSNLNDGIYYI